MKSFNEKCYAVLSKVPKGNVTTYGEIAKAIGSSRAARAVGNAMNKNPYAPKVPCHRCVGSNGGMTGFASGIPSKIKMLKAEGVVVKRTTSSFDRQRNASREKWKVDLGKFGFRFNKVNL